MSDFDKALKAHLETWGPNCGAPQLVYAGHLRILLDAARADLKAENAQLRAQLAEERARLDAVIDNRWAIHRKTSCSQNSTTFSVVGGGGYGAQLSISADPREAIDKARAGKGQDVAQAQH